MKRRMLSMLTCLALFLTLLPATARAANATLDIAAGSIVITDTGYTQGATTTNWPADGDHTLTITGSVTGNGTAATNMIDIQGGDPVITLSGITITMDPTARDTCPDRFRPPVLLRSGDATIILDGSSTLSGGDQAPGIQINGGATLTIRGSGSLHASSSNHTGGIGAGRVSKYGASGGGNLVIEGGTITASGTGNSGAIGSSYNRTFGSIKVKGGELTTSGSNSSLKADSITISGGTLTGLHKPILAGTVSITGGNIGNCYDGEVSGRKLTKLYFADVGSALANTQVTITEDVNTWTAKTDSKGIITTYLAEDTTSISAKVNNSSSVENILISGGFGVLGADCSCAGNGTLTVTDPGPLQVVGASADVPLEAVYTPASACTLPAGFHGAYENISFAISQIVKDGQTIPTAAEISQYARINGSTLTVYRKDTPYTVCVQAVSGPTEGPKVSSAAISIPVHSQTSASGEIRLDIAAGPILITGTGYSQGGGQEVLWGDNTAHALTITQSRSGSVSNYIQVSADAKITLNNVSLNGSYSGGVSAIPESSNFGPFFIYDNATVELILEGENTLQSTVAAAGLEVCAGSTLTIRVPEGADDSSGKLTAIGNAEAAGIGGSRWRGAGAVNIQSGTIDASCSGAYASGIGPGRLQSMEAIEITGGVITNRCGNTADQYNFSLGTSKDGATDSVRISGGKIDTNGVGGTSLTITGGAITTSKSPCFDTAKDKLSITGGYFTADPSDYLPQGYWAVTSTEPGYGYMVTDQPPVETTAAVKPYYSPSFGAVEQYAGVSGLVEAFSESLLKSWTAAYEKPGNKIKVQLIFIMMATGENLTSKEATATYQTSLTATIIVNDRTAYNTDSLSNDALNGRDFTVRLPLPEGLKDPVEVICVAKDGARERLTGSDLKIDTDKNWVDVTVNHLCTFIVNASPTNAATIDGASYGTLQEAVNGAASGATITLSQDCTEKITVSGKSLTIDLNGKAYYSDLVSVGANCTKTVSGDKIIVTYSAPYVPSQPSGGSSSSGDYQVSVAASRNGKVTVSPGWADEGDTVTLTVKPSSGYELSKLTVTDAKGNELKLSTKDGVKYTFIMPDTRVEVHVSFVPVVQQPVNPFTDVSKSDYYYNAVLWAVENGVTSGTSATTFGPNVTVTRAQAMTFLWRAHGSPKATGSNPFTDVSASDYYYDAVLWAVANGVTSGTSATTFSPDAPVTRAQAMTFQWRAAGSPAVSGSSFGDMADSAYYADAVSWAVTRGITSGTGDGQFSPDIPVTRAQAVTFLWRELA